MSTYGKDNISNFKLKILTTERLKSTRLANINFLFCLIKPI